MKFCPKCTSIVDDSVIECPACGSKIGERQYQVERHSMNWFSFLIKWSLFATAIWNVLQAISIMNSGTEEIYLIYGYQYDDYTLTFGIICIIYAAFAVFTRFMLSKYKKSGPYLLYGLITFPILSRIAEGIWTINMCQDIPAVYERVVSKVQVEVVGVLIWQSILLVCNCIYFTKRRELFKN